MYSEKEASGIYDIRESTIANTIELVQVIMKQYGIPIENVMRRYDVTHKICQESFVRVPER